MFSLHVYHLTLLPLRIDAGLKYILDSVFICNYSAGECRGDAVPSAGVWDVPSSLPRFSFAAAGGMNQVLEELLPFYPNFCKKLATVRIPLKNWEREYFSFGECKLSSREPKPLY